MGQSSDTGRRRTCTAVQLGRDDGAGECAVDADIVDGEVESGERRCGGMVCDGRPKAEAIGVATGREGEIGGKEEPVGVCEAVDRASDRGIVDVTGCLRYPGDGEEPDADETRLDWEGVGRVAPEDDELVEACLRVEGEEFVMLPLDRSREETDVVDAYEAGRMGSMRGVLGDCRFAKRSIKTRSCSRFASRHLRVDSMSPSDAEEEPVENLEVDEVEMSTAGP